MSEPSSSVPGEIADADVQQVEDGDRGGSEHAEPQRVDLELEEEKLEAWDEVRSDYEVDPDGKPVPNSMDPVGFEPVRDEGEDTQDTEDGQDTEGADTVDGDAGDGRGDRGGTAHD